MTTRLPTGILVSALLRQVNDGGGMAVVLARGDAQAGGMLAIIVDRSAGTRAVERGLDAQGRVALIESYRGSESEDYWRRRRRYDPDLWVIELDSPQAERFAAETMLPD